MMLSRRRPFLFLGMIDTGIEADFPYPGADKLISLIALEAFPKIDKNLLKQINNRTVKKLQKM